MALPFMRIVQPEIINPQELSYGEDLQVESRNGP